MIPTTKEIVLAAKLGDDKCIQLLKNAGRYVAIGIINSISIINPSKVIIGGRLIRDNDIFYDEMIKTVKKDAIPELIKDMKIEVSALGDLATAMCSHTVF